MAEDTAVTLSETALGEDLQITVLYSDGTSIGEGMVQIAIGEEFSVEHNEDLAVVHIPDNTDQFALTITVTADGRLIFSEMSVFDG